MPDLVLGCDGGASKTHLALADRAGRLRAFAPGPGTNHEGRGIPAIIPAFRDMFRRALRQARAKPRDVKAGCFGLGGVDLPEDVVQIQRRVIRPLGMGGPSLVTNDAFIAMFNDRYRDRGIAVTSGSWTKWLGMNGRKMFMHDGWGHVGIRGLAVQDLSRVYEGYRKPTAYTEALLQFIKFPSYGEFVRRTYFGDGKRSYIRNTTPAQHERIHRIPEFLGTRSQRGDREAVAVFDRYARELAEGIAAMMVRVELRGKAFEVVLSGSVLSCNPALVGCLRRRLKVLAPKAWVVLAVARPIRGALHYAAHLAGWSLPSSALRDPRLWYSDRQQG